MLEVLAELWDTKVFVNDRTNAETQDQLTDRMLDAAAEYAAPDLHRYHLQMFMEDLRDAVNARTRWEQDGILPDTIADEDYPALFSDAMVLDRVCGDVDDALFPILSGSDFPCVACRRTKASVAFWQPRETGAYCEDCRKNAMVNACPECDEGVVVDAGPMERETGHQPYACSANCGYGG